MSLPVKNKLNRVDQTVRQLPQAVYITLGELKVSAWRTDEPVSFANRESGEPISIQTGDVWGKLWDCAWFHFTGTVPKDAAAKSVVLLIDLGGEGLIVDHDGNPVQGLTSISSGFDFSLGKPGKRVFPIANPSTGAEIIDIWVDAGLNDLFGNLPNGGKLDEARIAVRREEVQALCFDFEVLRELVNHLPEKSARYASVVQALYEASLLLGHGTEDDSVIAEARKRLAPELAKAGGDPSLTISAIGHAHIDLAWLWPIRETIRKGARTFSTVLRMMERYPDYMFGASQPQIYQWMKDYYPNLYQEIKARVAEGRWEVQGAMWVEPDCNIPSGESLARQMLYGKRFFRQEFGIDVTNLWEPDVFGYSGSIPQILQKGGVDTFLTQKLSWSLFNDHPHHTFNWEGIDGTSVLVHMPPEATYNSSAAPRAIARAENDYLDKDLSDECLLLFGSGDGGGGPGEEHLERLARERNLSGLAPVVQESSHKFFERLKENQNRYAKWRGELYLERHQGTLTSQARNKWFNRKIEFALRELELSSARNIASPDQYPSEALDRIWKEILLLQFHDILPGSSITRVFDESIARYEALLAEVTDLTTVSDTALLGSGTKGALSNSLSWNRTDWVKVGDDWHLVEVPAMGFASLEMPKKAFDTPKVSPTSLENEYLRIALSDTGEIVSIFDKEAGRETLRLGQAANHLCVYEDHGDAWDFPVDYDSVSPQPFLLKTSEVITDGPRSLIRQTRSFGQSTLTQDIVLTSGSRRLDFVTHVDWQERRKMLRSLFPVALQSDVARCDIQFGNIERPIHANTSWDWAKNEICAQKWIDISETDYGVALLNDSKYGHSVRDGVINLNLLRSATYPDPMADHACHNFTYSMYPHLGNYVIGGVVRAAYELNVPLRLIQTDAKELPIAFAHVSSQDVVIEAVKKSEDSDAIIVRMVEVHGKSVATKINFGFEIREAHETNLIEDELRSLPIERKSIALTFRPFEILTLKVQPQ